MRDTKSYLNSMPPEQLDKLASQLDRVESLVKIAQIVIGMVVAAVSGLITVALWVNNTSTALAATRAEVQTLSKERVESVKEWSAWRSKKDEVDTRVLQILEGQQRILDRQQTVLDRVTLRD